MGTIHVMSYNNNVLSHFYQNDFLEKSKIPSLRAERSNLTYCNYLYLLDCFVAALLAMTLWMTFYEIVINV